MKKIRLLTLLIPLIVGVSKAEIIIGSFDPCTAQPFMSSTNYPSITEQLQAIQNREDLSMFNQQWPIDEDVKDLRSLYVPHTEIVENINMDYHNYNPVLTELDLAIAFMCEYGMTDYCSVDEYAPSRNITREESAKMFSIFAIEVLNKTPDTSIPCVFSDINLATPDLQDDIITSCQLGIFKGYNGGFNPKGNIKRVDTQVILIRTILGMLSENGEHYYDTYRQAGYDMGLFDKRPLGDSFQDRGGIAIYMYEYMFPKWRNNQGSRTDM